jgi:hypothetical protein
VTSDGLVTLRLSQEMRQVPELKVWIIRGESKVEVKVVQTELAGGRVRVRVDPRWGGGEKVGTR